MASPGIAARPRADSAGPAADRSSAAAPTVEGGGVKGVTGEFPLKPGRVTLARLGEKRDGDGFRMLIATATRLIRNSSSAATRSDRFDAGCDKLREVVIGQGWEHHYALSYGDIVPELLDICRILGIEPTVVQ